MKPLSGILSLLIAVSGWYYMFYSRAAERLGPVEGTAVNIQRVRLRRVNGFMMFILAVCLFSGVWTLDPHQTPRAFLTVWGVAIVLLFAIVLLALLDVRLTHRLRRRPTPPDNSEGNRP